MVLDMHALLAQATVDWGIRPIDILVTVLLTIIGGLTSWVLKTALQLKTDTTRLKDKVGLDNGNGLVASHREQAESFRTFAKEQAEAWKRFDRMMNKVMRRIERLEEHAKVKPPKDDDSTEDD